MNILPEQGQGVKNPAVTVGKPTKRQNCRVGKDSDD